MTKQIRINAFYSASPSQSWPGLWTHPDSEEQDYNSIEYWTKLARICETGLIDGVFFADVLALPSIYQGKPDAALTSGTFCPINDPMMLIPVMASVTEHLSFGVTGNTTYEPPYLLARRMSTLDHLTKGRVAWNVVTGMMPPVAKAMGKDKLPPHDMRYDIADEFMEVVYRLWEQSWDDDAVKRDKINKIFTDPSKVRPIKFDGENFKCEAVHMTEPSPQRTPFIFAAGASGRGMEFAGKHAEAAFISANNIPYAKMLTSKLREAAVGAGRAGDDVSVFNAAAIVVARTDKEAEELRQEIAQYSSAEGNLAFMSVGLGIDLSKYDIDEPIKIIESDAIQSMVTQLTDHNGGRVPTIRDLVSFGPLRGPEYFICGSPQTVCDEIIKMVDETGIDGLNLTRTVEPTGIKAFCDLVVPELQNRGYYKSGYDAGTLREKMHPGRGRKTIDTHPSAAARLASV
jgi:long-chain alkane monooxygenase